MKSPFPKNKPDYYQAFQYPIAKKISLTRPLDFPENQFLDVLLSRRSEKPEKSISQKETGEILYLSNRIEEFFIDDSGFIRSYRVSPSGGARHPIDNLTCTLNSLENGLSYYNPLDHSLNSLKVTKADLQNFLDDVASNSNMRGGTLVWFAIQFEKTSSGYKNPESLYWRDLGVLLYCTQLVATFLGYKSCPIGALVPESFHKLIRSDRLISGGGIVIGK